MVSGIHSESWKVFPANKEGIPYIYTPIHLPTHPFIFISMHSPTLTLLSIHSSFYSFTQKFFLPSTPPPVSPLCSPFIYFPFLFFHSPTHLSIHSSFYPLTHPSILSSIHLPIHPPTHPMTYVSFYSSACPSFHYHGPDACQREGMRKTISESGNHDSM